MPGRPFGDLQALEPRECALHIERAPEIPAGSEDRFRGYGLMGLSFSSGHVLAMRRWPASSIGPGYTSVWHRAPEGRWTFYADVEADQSCARYFKGERDAAQLDRIAIAWTGARRFVVTVRQAGLHWNVVLADTPATRLANRISRVVPERWWQEPRFLDLIEVVAGRGLGAGSVALRGRTPNGQRYLAQPRLVWMVAASAATLRGQDLGYPDSAAQQARLGDFRIPRRGIFAIAEARLQPAATPPAPAPR